MYLTRMKLDETRRDTMRALASPNLFHGAVEQSFSGERKRRLWRIDRLNQNVYLLILSEDKPDLMQMSQQFGVSGADPAWETKEYSQLLDRIERGSVWHFRLEANPTKSCPSERQNNAGKRERGVIHAHITTKHQENWLLERAERHGFLLAESGFSAVHTSWKSFDRGIGKRRVTILAVAFEGVLTVTDVELFRQTLTNGIGRGKAYGLGLLTIARLNNHG